MATRTAAAMYEITLEGQTYVLRVGRTVYRLPQCVCEVHENECSYGTGQPHPAWKPGNTNPRAWSVANVRQLADLVAGHKVPEPGPTPYRGRDRLAGVRKAPKEITPDKIVALQRECDEAEIRGGI